MNPLSHDWYDHVTHSCGAGSKVRQDQFDQAAHGSELTSETIQAINVSHGTSINHPKGDIGERSSVGKEIRNFGAQSDCYR